MHKENMTNTTTLKQRIIDLIALNGPISVAEYMNLCLSDPQHGYYMTREPFGRKGDFITAPEISQLFGEILGIWCFMQWQALQASAAQKNLNISPKAPRKITLSEIGPGRGTLMKDILRALKQLAPDIVHSIKVVMIETSPRLQAIQKQTLNESGFCITWNNTLEAQNDNPLILVANELFDALPIRQFVKLNGHYQERMVGLNEQKELCFLGGSTSIDQALLPSGHQLEPTGSIFEISPARSALMQQIAELILKNSGAALLIDYGYIKPGFADTLQALKDHKFDDVFAHPGEADLTSHVDFSALNEIAKKLNCKSAMTTQGEFLLSLGILERAGQLGYGKDIAMQEQIKNDVERLASPTQMGNLFKVLAISSNDISPIPNLNNK